MTNLGKNRVFALGLRKTTENFERDGLDYICEMSVPVLGETTTSIPNEFRRSSGRIGLACVGAPAIAAGSGEGPPEGRDDQFRDQLQELLLGVSLLRCALQMLSRGKSSSD
jgi:hypothetical protein